jgi:multidrug efflux pump
VLLFFLGVRNSGFVALSIPLSMLLSFIVMQMMGMTMNNIVLYSLILALGMLVDNAIVVVENIYRHLERGYDNFDAARLGTGEVAMPIIVSTATTLARSCRCCSGRASSASSWDTCRRRSSSR